MRKALFKIIIIAALALVAIAAVFMSGLFSHGASDNPLSPFGSASRSLTAYADTSNTYFESYDIIYDISPDRVITTTEQFTVNFDGDETITRDIDVSSGQMVRNVSVQEIISGAVHDATCHISSSSYQYLAVEIGDETQKYAERTYVLSYEYCITKAANVDVLSLMPIGEDLEYRVEAGTIKCILPDGFAGTATCTALQSSRSVSDYPWTQGTEDGRVTLTASFTDFSPDYTLSLEIDFTEGSLSVFTDYTPLWFAFTALVLIVIIAALKFTVLRGRPISRMKSFNVIRDMNPLLMGKFADNKVDKEDISALVIYWANKGYLKIDIRDSSDPVLIRVADQLPDTCKKYEKFLFYNLFREHDRVQSSQLKNKFYKVADVATAHINENTKGLYDNISILVSIVFTIIGALLLGVSPLVLGSVQVSSSLHYYMSFILIIPALVIYEIAETILYNTTKSRKALKAVLWTALVAVCAAIVLIYTFMVPSYIIGTLNKVLISIAYCLLFVASPVLIRRTKKYTDELDDILGFRNALLAATREDVIRWSAKEPEVYYKIMPFARVMGLADWWEEKYEGLPLVPPSWAIMPPLPDNPTFEDVDAPLRKAEGIMHVALTSRPATGEGNAEAPNTL